MTCIYGNSFEIRLESESGPHGPDPNNSMVLFHSEFLSTFSPSSPNSYPHLIHHTKRSAMFYPVIHA